MVGYNKKEWVVKAQENQKEIKELIYNIGKKIICDDKGEYYV